mmetsp:Transcript_9538/g.12402  ORF Transcript_9538/g.12402 Transcript_9538/m.12402 type:complete len:129 (+) Transcript_9538:187-573(+)
MIANKETTIGTEMITVVSGIIIIIRVERMPRVGVGVTMTTEEAMVTSGITGIIITIVRVVVVVVGTTMIAISDQVGKGAETTTTTTGTTAQVGGVEAISSADTEILFSNLDISCLYQPRCRLNMTSQW